MEEGVKKIRSHCLRKLEFCGGQEAKKELENLVLNK